MPETSPHVMEIWVDLLLLVILPIIMDSLLLESVIIMIAKHLLKYQCTLIGSSVSLMIPIFVHHHNKYVNILDVFNTFQLLPNFIMF